MKWNRASDSANRGARRVIQFFVRPVLEPVMELVNDLIGHFVNVQGELKLVVQKTNQLEDWLRETNRLRDLEGKEYALHCPHCDRISATVTTDDSVTCRRCGAHLAKKLLTDSEKPA